MPCQQPLPKSLLRQLCGRALQGTDDPSIEAEFILELSRRPARIADISKQTVLTDIGQDFGLFAADAEADRRRPAGGELPAAKAIRSAEHGPPMWMGTPASGPASNSVCT